MADSPKKNKSSRIWIRNTNGEPSMSATFAVIAFFTTTAMYVASFFEKIGPVTIRPFDPGICAAYLVPTLTLYFGRRTVDTKITVDASGGDAVQ